MNPISETYNMDCMEYMRQFPDKHFQLSIVDPPYGETCKLTGGKAKKDGYADYWDKITENGNWNVAPNKDYFNELFRVSKNQIIWGLIITHNICRRHLAGFFGTKGNVIFPSAMANLPILHFNGS